MENIRRVLSQYEMGDIEKVTKISVGLINETYLLEGKNIKFILQKVSPIFRKEVHFDIDAVSRHLDKKGLLVQRIVSSRSGNLYVESGSEIWRLLSFIPGRTFNIAASSEIIYEAGKILGTFHRAVDDLNYIFQFKRSMHHTTQEFYYKLKQISSKAYDADFQSLIVAVACIPNYYLPNNLRKNITHGDPKLSNIIFNEYASGAFKAMALIDLDDCGRELNLLIDLGDAFRSWCGLEEDNEYNFFDLEKFKAGLTGYIESSKAFIKKAELEFLPKAIKLITLELAARFLIDYLEDRYFSWDFSRYASRKEHNFARARGQVALFYDIEIKSKEISRIIFNLNSF